MAPQKQKVAMAGVADGKELISVPTGDESAEERVRALFSGSMSKDMYQVSLEFCYFKVPVLLKVNSASSTLFSTVSPTSTCQNHE